ncbi:MAG: chemotaxis response regulator protein-glutamate methylesterase [Gammaproteobacteria bacterium]|nr:chemotaxis response regulator protein-glutamate methylesterase [Gammaproteobacteria bacterium]
MTVKVLIVDDSGFFRRRLTEIISSDPLIEVIGSANNGKEAIEQARILKPDVITMDIEMPVMNGIEATKQIMQTAPTRILMFSSLTYDGATATLNALEAGAADFLPKKFEEISSQSEDAVKLLTSRIKDLGRSALSRRPLVKPVDTQLNKVSAPATSQPSQVEAPRRRTLKSFDESTVNLVAIGTSTGGPVALQSILTTIPASFKSPILIVQHMPPKFTEAFANRLDKICNISVREATHDEKLVAGVALVAPGGMQLDVVKKGRDLVVKIKESLPSQNYKPCIDDTFESIAMSVGAKTLGIILTGMGADGREGCRRMKQTGAQVWAQDEETSLIYGMPAAVAQANLADYVLPLPAITKLLAD